MFRSWDGFVDELIGNINNNNQVMLWTLGEASATGQADHLTKSLGNGFVRAVASTKFEPRPGIAAACSFQLEHESVSRVT